MNQAQRLKILQNTDKTVFSASFLHQAWGLSGNHFRVTVKRMVDRGLLQRLSRGIYALSDEYNVYELASALVVPSYLSFNTALFYHGAAFQFSHEIESAANFSHRKEIDGRKYVYRKIKKSLLYDSDGQLSQGLLTVATIERAIVDCFYHGLTPNIDRIDKVNLTRLKVLAEKYPVRVRHKVNSLL